MGGVYQGHGIDEAADKSKTTGSVYVLSVYRPVTGHREQLEAMFSEAACR